MANDRLVNVTLTANTAPYVAGMNTATAATQRTAATATAASAGIQRTGQSMATTAGQAGLLRQGLTTPIAAAGAAIAGTAKASIDWESSWAGVTKTVDGSAQQMERLEGDLRDMATTLPATHGEIAGVAEAAGQLGVETENVSAFTRTMVDLGETTNLTADQAATSVARITNVMGTAESDVDRLGSSLADLGNNSATTEAEIVGMAQRIAGAGSTIGMTEQDVLGFAAALSSVGIRAEAGGTAISRVMVDMSNAVESGGEKLSQLANVAGMSADEFAAAFREDPAAAIDAFVGGLGEIQAAGGNVFATLEQLDMGQVRIRDALLRMSESGDVLTNSLDISNEAWEENIALTEEAERRYDTAEARISTAWSQIKDGAIDAGGVIVPVLEGVVTGAAESVSWLQRLGDELANVAAGGDGEEGTSGRAVQGALDLIGEGHGPFLAMGQAAVDAGGAAEDAADDTESFLTQIREGAEDAIPMFADALSGSSRATREAEGAQEDLGAQVETTTGRLDDERDKLESLKTTMFDAEQQTLDLREAKRAYEEQLDTTTETIARNGETLDDSTDAGRENAESIDLIAERTHAQIRAMAEQGSSLEEVTEFTQNARDEFVNAAEAAGMETDEAKALADQLGLVPSEVETRLEAINNAEATIERLEERLAELETRQVLIDIRARAVNDPASIVTPWMQHAGGPVMHGGGEVPRMHSGGLRSDERAIVAQKGEFMMQESAVDRYGQPFMHAVNDGQLERAMAPMARGPMGGGGASGMAGEAAQIVIQHMEMKAVGEPFNASHVAAKLEAHMARSGAA